MPSQTFSAATTSGLPSNSQQKRKRKETLTSDLLKSAPVTARSSSRVPIFLKSAFGPPIVFSCDPPMLKLLFIRTTVTFQPSGNVEMAESDIVESIEVA